MYVSYWGPYANTTPAEKNLALKRGLMNSEIYISVHFFAVLRNNVEWPCYGFCGEREHTAVIFFLYPPNKRRAFRIPLGQIDQTEVERIVAW